MSVFSRITPKLWAWIHFKVALGIVLPILILIGSRGGSAADDSDGDGLLTSFIVLWWVVASLVGAVVSIAGIFMGAHPRTARRGIAIELSGLYFLLSGPIVAVLVFMYLVFLLGQPQWLASMGLSYAVGAAVIARITMIVPLYHRALTDPETTGG